MIHPALLHVMVLWLLLMPCDDSVGVACWALTASVLMCLRLRASSHEFA